MSEEIKRWTSRHKASLVIQIVKGRTTFSEASREFDLPLAEILSYAQSPRIFVNNTRVKMKEFTSAYGEAIRELLNQIVN